MDALEVRVGTAGWTVPAAVRERFGGEGAQLERYARRLSCAEINSTFYRPHRASTYERWAASVPDAFRFAVKAPKTISHERKLVDALEPLDAFLAETAHLGDKRDVVLVQLPPKLAYDERTAGTFFAALRERYAGRVACEPRHPTWFHAQADALLARLHVARVAADPAVVPDGGRPGGWGGFAYYRYHGAPRTYYSSYDETALRALGDSLRESRCPVWCIFDNTASGAAAANALDVADSVAAERGDAIVTA